MKVSLKLRGPSRKAKYSLATDSEPSSASERWEEPLQGEDSEPETTCLQAVGARLDDVPPLEFYGTYKSYRADTISVAERRRRVTACLLHNDPATYRHQQG